MDQFVLFFAFFDFLSEWRYNINFYTKSQTIRLFTLSLLNTVKQNFRKVPNSLECEDCTFLKTGICMHSPSFGTVFHVKNARARFKALNVRTLHSIQPTNYHINIILNSCVLIIDGRI